MATHDSSNSTAREGAGGSGALHIFWDETERNAWITAQTRRVKYWRRTTTLTVSFLLVMAALTVAVRLILSTMHPDEDSARWDLFDFQIALQGDIILAARMFFAAIASIGLPGVVLWVVSRFLRERRLLQAAKEHRPFGCPHCLSALEASHGDPEVRCSRCGLQEERCLIESYWRDHARLRRLSPSWRAYHRTQRTRQKHRLLRDSLDLARLDRFDATFVVIMLGIVLYAAAASSSTSWGPLVTVPIVLGLSLVLGPVLAYRVGDEQFCGGCNYPKHSPASGPSCPECGADWSWSCNVERGTIPKKRIAAIFAVTLLVIATWQLGGNHLKLRRASQIAQAYSEIVLAQGRLMDQKAKARAANDPGRMAELEELFDAVSNMEAEAWMSLTEAEKAVFGYEPDAAPPPSP